MQSLWIQSLWIQSLWIQSFCMQNAEYNIFSHTLYGHICKIMFALKCNLLNCIKKIEKYHIFDKYAH